MLAKTSSVTNTIGSGGSPSGQKIVLITGSGSGIGLALAKLLANNERFIVVATARPLALKELLNSGLKENDRFLMRPLDVLSSNSRKILLRQLQARWGGCDVLVNNAGISFRSSIEDMDSSEEELQMATNYFAPLALIREVVPEMRRRRCGQIINVSSVGGMMAMPTMGSYSASKFALEGATEALWYELKPWGISVNLIQPGVINSNSFRKVYRSGKSRSDSAYAKYYSNMEKFIETLMTNSLATSNSVAQKMCRLIENGGGPLRVPATIDAHVFSLLRRLLPRELYHRVLFRCLPHIRDWVGENEPTTDSAFAETAALTDAVNFKS